MKRNFLRSKSVVFLAVVLVISMTALLTSCANQSNQPKKETKEMNIMPAQEGENPTNASVENRIATNGQGVTLIEPERARIVLGIATINRKAVDASTDNAQKMNALIDAMKKAGIDEKDIHTMNYSIYARYDYSQDTREFVGYEVSNSLEVIVKDINKTSQILDSAVNAGANQVDSVNFIAVNKKEAYNKALEAAVTDAKEKAELLAKAAGMTGELRVVSINENYSPDYTPRENALREMKEAAATPLLPNQEEVHASVTVEFAVK